MIGNISNSYNPYSSYGGYNLNVSSVNKDDTDPIKLQQLKRTGKIECETCSSRRYQDGSNEGNVSFKSPGHISPSASRAVVSAHEAEHVANAVSEGSEPGKELISASVTLQSATCPECGTSYISGGTTTTQMKYSNEDNPYQQAKKQADAILLKGQNIDYAA